jgi:hypothetical protein
MSERRSERAHVPKSDAIYDFSDARRKSLSPTTPSRGRTTPRASPYQRRVELSPPKKQQAGRDSRPSRPPPQHPKMKKKKLNNFRTLHPSPVPVPVALKDPTPPPEEQQAPSVPPDESSSSQSDVSESELEEEKPQPSSPSAGKEAPVPALSPNERPCEP